MRLSRSCVAGLFLLVVTWPPAALASDLVRSHPDLAILAGGIQRIVLLPPRMAMYEIGAGGTLEKKEDWIAAAEANLVQAVQRQVCLFDNLRFGLFDDQALDGSTRLNYDETRALYTLIPSSTVPCSSIRMALTGSAIFPRKPASFVIH